MPFWSADPHKIPIDPNGNLTQKTEGTDSWGYEWNARNELTRVTKNSVEQARFSYDPLGRRVEKVAGGVTSAWTYDGTDIARESRGATTLKYIHGPWIDEPLASDDGVALTYFHADGLGSIAKRTSQAGAVVQEYRYDAWGNLDVGASELGYAFTGREWDPETGLYYYRARYYDPRSGRFISQDPIGFEGGMNPYLYVEDRPTVFRDPRGESAAGIAFKWWSAFNWTKTAVCLYAVYDFCLKGCRTCPEDKECKRHCYIAFMECEYMHFHMPPAPGPPPTFGGGGASGSW